MMSEILQLESSQEMTSLQGNLAHVQLEKPSAPVVTTAEVSSQEMTLSDSPKQPQAGNTTVSLPAPLSTVHVQLPISASHGRTSIPVLTHSVSEPVHYHNPRKLLTRSKAVRSPPPMDDGPDLQNTPVTTVNTSFDSCDSGISSELPPRLEAFRSKSFSRDSSFEYTDSTGTDLHEFIVKTLKNPRDRKLLIRLERDFLEFTQDPSRLFIQYPPMTSYHRMIVHRVAAYFGMDHNVDQSGKSVIINKTQNTRIPDLRFVELVSRDESEDSDIAPRSILRRQNTPSGDNTPPKIDSPISMLTMEDKRSKSIEEREEEYNKARHRIFNQDSLSSQSSQSSLDLQFQQALLREEEEGNNTENPKEKRVHVLSKAQSFDERNLEKITSASDAKVPTTKVLTRSSSSPGISRERLFQQSQSNSPKGGSRQLLTGSSGVYWPTDGMTTGYQQVGGEMHMVPVQTFPGMMTVPAASGPPVPGQASQAGGVLWNVPQDGMQQGAVLINPSTGTPVLGPDGNPLLVQPSYQSVVVKPGSGGTPVAPDAPNQQSVAQSGGQVVLQQYATGMPQPMYVVQQQPRTQYVQQPNAEGAQAVTWPPGGTGYPDMSAQFGAMSIGGQQADPDSSSTTGQLTAVDSNVATTSAVAGPVYVSSMTQSSYPVQPGQVQYMVMPNPSTGQLRQVTDQTVQQAVPSAQQPQAAYILASPSHPSYQPHTTFQQYPMSGDSSVMQQPRSQTPPTPPRTSSPVYTSHHYSQPQFVVGSPSSQQVAPNHVNQAHAPQFQQHTPSQTPTQVVRHTVPFIVPVGRAVAVNPHHRPPPSVHFHASPVAVQGQYPGGQKRPFNVDRRQPKSSEMYQAEIPVVIPGQAVPSGSTVQMALPYGENVGVLDRNHYGQYVHYQRFPPPSQVMGNSGTQYQLGKPKHKHQQHRRVSSPRSQSHHGQGNQGQGQQERTKSPRQGSRTSTPEAEGTTGS